MQKAITEAWKNPPADRVARKLTMKEFAEQCGISERYLADIERGIKAPKLETFVGIVNAAPKHGRTLRRTAA